MDMDRLIANARDLASDDGSNPEYDRALVELVARMMPNLHDGGDAARAYAESAVLA